MTPLEVGQIDAWVMTSYSRKRASLHCSRRHDFRALLRDRVALGRTTVAGVDNDDNRLFETRAAMSGDYSNVRRRSSVLALSCSERGQEFGEEIRSSIAGAKDRHDLRVADSRRVASLCSFPIRGARLFF